MPKVLATALAIEMVVLGALLTIAADLYAHKRVEQLGGVNIWGYRGPVMRQREPDEIRIAVVGGDLAFGWGVAASETLAPNVRRLVALQTDRPGMPLMPVVAVNLGAMGLPPLQYAAWIERFAYLRTDVVCLVLDPRQHLPQSRAVPDRQSVAFTTFGYAPILPLVLGEKGTTAGWPVLRSAGAALFEADRALSRIRGGESLVHGGEQAAASDAAAYAGAIAAAVRIALDHGARVVVVAPIYENDGDVADHQRVKTMVSALDRETGRVRFVDLGDEPGLYDDGLKLDGFNFGAGGHAIAAELIAPAVLSLLGARP